MMPSGWPGGGLGAVDWCCVAKRDVVGVVAAALMAEQLQSDDVIGSGGAPQAIQAGWGSRMGLGNSVAGILVL